MLILELKVTIMSALLPLLLLLPLSSCASLPAIEAAADAPIGPRDGATRLRRAPGAAGRARRLGLGGRARRHGSGFREDFRADGPAEGGGEEGARRRKKQRKKRDRAIAKAAEDFRADGPAEGGGEESARRRKQQRKKRDRAIAKAAAQAAARQAAVAARFGQADLDGTAAAEDTARIVGGRVVEPQERYPYMASFYPDKACGGALIHPRVVLTAAHCVAPIATSPTPTVEAPAWTEGEKCPFGHLETYFQSGTAYASRATAKEACSTGCLTNDACLYADLFFGSWKNSSTYATCYLKGADCGDYASNRHSSYSLWIRPTVDVGRWNLTSVECAAGFFDSGRTCSQFNTFCNEITCLECTHCDSSDRESNHCPECLVDGGDTFDTHAIADSVPHPGWGWNATAVDDPDFALVLLATPSAMAPVTLAREEADAPLGADAIVMGWGSTVADSTNTNPLLVSARLKEASIAIAANDTCGLIPVVDGDETEFEIGVVKGPHVLCGAEGDGVSCVGDSGGPLIVAGEDAAGDVLVGIVSYGPPKCGDFNAAYARVSWAYDWIEATMLTKWGLALDTAMVVVTASNTAKLNNLELSEDTVAKFVRDFEKSMFRYCQNKLRGEITVTVTAINDVPFPRRRALARRLQYFNVISHTFTVISYTIFTVITHTTAEPAGDIEEETRDSIVTNLNLEGVDTALETEELQKYGDFSVGQVTTDVGDGAGPIPESASPTVSPTKNPTKHEGRFKPLAKSSKSHGSSKSAKTAPSKGSKRDKTGSKHGSKSSKSSKG